ncbi:MAG: hypothetical protein A2X36_10110 [Elusimicrobia bacterium GWA2_69_24]|nr:MAG: hypothetical protein A2X36_10110 [Elusimicrobia bacterium GWA2_69_24]HBL17943.1 hypothetical protein [Elusimicrobiota bacterium]
MRSLTLLLVLFCAAPAPARLGAASSDVGEVLRSKSRVLGDSAYSLKKLSVLREGRYKCVVAGVLCNVCTRSIVDQLKRIAGVKEAQFDFEEGFLYIVIDKDRTVRAGKVRRALSLAARKANLHTRYEITDIRFVP